jgi:hypothetical protein
VESAHLFHLSSRSSNWDRSIVPSLPAGPATVESAPFVHLTVGPATVESAPFVPSFPALQLVESAPFVPSLPRSYLFRVVNQ